MKKTALIPADSSPVSVPQPLLRTGVPLALVRGFHAPLIRKLEAAEIRTVQELLALAPEDASKRTGLSIARVRDLLLHARAAAEGRALPRRRARFPAGVPIYFYDVETYGGRTYLHGAIRLDGSRREERSFFAAHPREAAEAWRGFLDWSSRDRKAVVYTWTTYENACLEDCRRRFGADGTAYGRLTGNLVDLKAWVERHWALPVRSYSIKAVAPVFGFSWQAPDASGLNSMRWYADWLRTGDAKLRAKLLEYNLDDVRAMERVYERLLAQTAKAAAVRL